MSPEELLHQQHGHKYVGGKHPPTPEEIKHQQMLADRKEIDRCVANLATAESAITAIRNNRRYTQAEKDRRIKSQQDSIQSLLQLKLKLRLAYKAKYGDWY